MDIDFFDVYQNLIELAKMLPTGANDPRARQKYRAEKRELAEKLAANDRPGALLEAADCLYYLAKSVFSKLMMFGEASIFFRIIVKDSGFSRAAIIEAALIKYTLRAQPGNPKDDTKERAAISHLLEAV